MVNKDFIEFLDFRELFRGTVDQFLMEVFRGKCNLVEFIRCKRKRLVLTRGGGGERGVEVRDTVEHSFRDHFLFVKTRSIY